MFRPPCQRQAHPRLRQPRADVQQDHAPLRQLQDPLARLRLRTLPHQALPGDPDQGRRHAQALMSRSASRHNTAGGGVLPQPDLITPQSPEPSSALIIGQRTRHTPRLRRQPLKLPRRTRRQLHRGASPAPSRRDDAPTRPMTNDSDTHRLSRISRDEDQQAWSTRYGRPHRVRDPPVLPFFHRSPFRRLRRWCCAGRGQPLLPVGG